MKEVLYIGLDVHKDSITIAIAHAGRDGEVRTYGKISGDLHALDAAISRLRKQYGKDVVLNFCYEAGPCGFVIARRLRHLGHACTVVAPSKLPRGSGQKVKTDRLDAEMLARHLRSGDAVAIYIPEITDEAIRDLCRARTDAVDDLTRSKQRLKSFLLRHGYHYQGNANWTPAHMRYLREIVLPHEALKAIKEEYLIAIRDAAERVERCEAAMLELLQSWRLKPAVDALMAFKGFKIVAAMITVTELGDLWRFEHPRQLMGYLGLVPSESSSGEGRKQGAITKCGNPHARWLLIQCAQHYKTKPKVSKELSVRQEGQPPEVLKVSWRAQHRLHIRMMRLAARRLHCNKAKVAVARELVGFIWEALRPLPCYKADTKA